jgi:hypothetical protein
LPTIYSNTVAATGDTPTASANIPPGSNQSAGNEDSSLVESTMELVRSPLDPQADWLNNYVVSNPQAVYFGTVFGGRDAGRSQNGMPVFARIISSQYRANLHPKTKSCPSLLTTH